MTVARTPGTRADGVLKGTSVLGSGTVGVIRGLDQLGTGEVQEPIGENSECPGAIFSPHYGAICHLSHRAGDYCVYDCGGGPDEIRIDQILWP